VVRQLYGHLPGKQLLWTPAKGGQWVSVQQCIFPDAACLQRDLPSNVSGSQAAVSPSRQQQQLQLEDGSAAGHGADDSSSSHGSSSGFGPLGEALVQLGVPLAVLPGSVLTMMTKYLVSL
jgi:hypothetical protein